MIELSMVHESNMDKRICSSTIRRYRRRKFIGQTRKSRKRPRTRSQSISMGRAELNQSEIIEVSINIVFNKE